MLEITDSRTRMSRLLIVKTSSLGDVIHNLPVITDIHAYLPDIEVDWVVEEGFASIPALHPGVSEVIPVAVRRWRKHLFSRATWREMNALKASLSSRRYDAVLDTQGLLKSALIAACADGERHGQNRRSAREPLASVFYSRKHEVARGQHAVQRNRELAAHAFGYPVPQSLPAYGINSPGLYSIPEMAGAYVVGLHATSRDSKLWPVDCWVALGRALATRGQRLLLPWGNDKEHHRAQIIAAAVPDACVLPRLGLGELADVLSGARAAIGVDTGLVHLSVALSVPTVAIYTDTDPRLTGVCPGDSYAVSLGGVGQTPAAGDVLAALKI